MNYGLTGRLGTSKAMICVLCFSPLSPSGRCHLAELRGGTDQTQYTITCTRLIVLCCDAIRLDIVHCFFHFCFLILFS